ncbi:MAG: peptidase [Acidobacteriota bacterium]|nr:peptidase [Acidobacteriota bacterium]
MRRFLLLALFLAVAAQTWAGTGKVVIVNVDAPGVGNNDPTPAQPVGGNPGTTLGQQRLNVYNAAAARWSTMLDTNIDILVEASFASLPCDDEGVVLGSAGPIRIFRDFTNAPRAGTWYPVALANRFAGRDLAAGINDISMRFNSDIDKATCPPAAGQADSNWYYGFDGNEGVHSDFFVVALHELAHGLGFSGGTRAPGFRDNFPSIFDVHTFDRTAGLRWDQMTEQQRQVSLTNTGNVVWDGQNVRSFINRYMQPVTMLSVTEPAIVARNYDIGTASFGPLATRAALSGRVVRALDAADGSGATTFDGCSAFSNAAAIAGNVAMIDRGNCTFVVKSRNAQAAGASGVLIADNARTTCIPPAMGGDAADITIPVFSISANDGDVLKTQLTAGAQVSGSLRSDPSQLAGTSPEGLMRLYAPCTDEPGSSIHHWDVVSTPNLLMEPAVNSDLLLGVDLSQFLMLDIGWTLPPKTGRRTLTR